MHYGQVEYNKMTPFYGFVNNFSNVFLLFHFQTEEKGQVFTCDIQGCDKKFGRNCELTRHKLNHMDVWPFSCDWPGCGRKFKRKDVFKNHQRTHRKEDGGSAVGTPGHDQEEEVMSQAALRAQLEARCNQVLVEDEIDEFDDEHEDNEDVHSYMK